MADASQSFISDSSSAYDPFFGAPATPLEQPRASKHIGYQYAGPSHVQDDSITRQIFRPKSTSKPSTKSSTSYAGGDYYELEPVDERVPRKRPGRLSHFLSRIWHRPVIPRRQQSLDRRSFQGELANYGTGLWTRQMLVDRSLLTMACTMALFAIVMWTIVFSYLDAFATRANKHSTSVGHGYGENCKTAESRNIAIHFFINISATMILGMSNTFQQLVTALSVDDIRHVLSKRGDSRVGTNSPFAINHKQSRRTRSWLAWLLLIFTSMPVHFLANSLIGPSLYMTPPSEVVYQVTTTTGSSTSYYDVACWGAFRSGAYHFPQDEQLMQETAAVVGPQQSGPGYAAIMFQRVNVSYFEQNCTQYKNTTHPSLTDPSAWLFENERVSSSYYVGGWGIGNCTLGTSVYCNLVQSTEQVPCRLSVRMQAAFILAACLGIKAAYMITSILLSRNKVKKSCLTFGDVVVASAIDPKLQVQGECMVNSGDGWREKVQHTCHKHCKESSPSSTGDELGHCQKCKAHNVKDKAGNLDHPVVAIKYKRSLISNLGSTAVGQMILLMFASISMLALTLTFAVLMIQAGKDWDLSCLPQNQDRQVGDVGPAGCALGRRGYLASLYGSWGGFNSSVVIAVLTSDSLTSEQIAFWISNGAQLLYSLLYLLLVYNITLVSMEHDWGKLEYYRQRLRCTIVRGNAFEQSYLLQLPKKVLFPLMAFSAMMHWLLGQSISTREIIWSDAVLGTEHSQYEVTTASYPIFISTILMISMTSICWWAFTFRREGFIPQMYGSIRVLCSSTTDLQDFENRGGVMWGDLGESKKFRHAGFSAGEVGKIIPAELYAGRIEPMVGNDTNKLVDRGPPDQDDKVKRE